MNEELLKCLSFAVFFLIDSQKLHLSLNPHKSELFSGSVAIVEIEFVSRLYISFGENTNPVISIDTQNLCTAVGVNRVVGKPYFVSFPSGVHHMLVVEIEQKGTHVFVVHLSSPVRFLLRNNLTTILRDKFIFGGEVLNENYL
jgi:hypothetical protein